MGMVEDVGNITKIWICFVFLMIKFIIECERNIPQKRSDKQTKKTTVCRIAFNIVGNNKFQTNIHTRIYKLNNSKTQNKKETEMTSSSWWFQPIWNILVKLDSQVGVKIKNIWNHQLVIRLFILKKKLRDPPAAWMRPDPPFA